MKRLTKIKVLILLFVFTLTGAILSGCEVHVHEKGEYLRTLHPTCEEPGYKYFTCSKCSQGNYIEYLPRLGHEYLTYVSNNDATCEQNGTETAVCSRETCTSTKTREIPNSALGHSFGEFKYNEDATCTADGTKTASCQREGCSVVRTEQAKGTILAHPYVVTKIEPTCTTQGYTVHNCSMCGDSFTDSFVEPLGHTEGAFATCTTAQTCTVCNVVITPALGHKGDGTVVCTSAEFCTVCGEVIRHAIPHKEIIDKAIASTCEKTGLTEGKHCSVCKEVLVEQIEIPLANHTEVIIQAIAPTCTRTGLTEGRYCSVCGSTIIKQTIAPALGHKEVVDGAIAPTCTKTGLTEGKHCSVCGEVLVVKRVIPALGHTEIVESAVAPTCINTGLTEGKHCSVCGEVFAKQTVIPALGHTEVIESAVAPTCTNTGLTEGKHCSVCGEIFVKQTVIPALGHTEVVDEAVTPTCTATGLTEGKHCSVCKEVLKAQETVAALGHTEVIDSAVTPTCTNTGLTEGKHCSVCNEVLVAQTVVPALGHTEVVESAVAPTCTNTGLTEGRHCSVCGEVLAVQTVLEPVDHNYKNGFCSYCGSKFETAYKYFIFTELSDGTYSVKAKDVNDMPANVLIPESYNGKPVTQVEQLGFRGCANLKSITVPNSVTTMGYAAFYQCDALESISIPFIGVNRNTTSGRDAVFGYIFGYSTNLVPSDSLYRGVLQYEDYQYYYFYKIPKTLTSVTVTNCEKLPSRAFYNCQYITSLTLLSKLTTINSYALYNCSGLKYINYCGASSEWSTISKGSNWNSGAGTYNLIYNYNG